MTRLSPYAFFRTGTLAAAGLALAAAGTVALAAPSASTAIAQRQANFKEMGRAMKTLKDQSTGGTIDRSAAVAAAPVARRPATVRLINVFMCEPSNVSPGRLFGRIGATRPDGSRSRHRDRSGAGGALRDNTCCDAIIPRRSRRERISMAMY